MNSISFTSKNTSHLPTKYEANVTEAMHNIYNFIWYGKAGNTSATDAITKTFSAIEIKGSESLGEQQLNSTPLCGKDSFAFALRMVGNAVPVELAKSIALTIIKDLDL